MYIWVTTAMVFSEIFSFGCLYFWIQVEIVEIKDKVQQVTGILIAIVVLCHRVNEKLLGMITSVVTLVFAVPRQGKHHKLTGTCHDDSIDK